MRSKIGSAFKIDFGGSIFEKGDVLVSSEGSKVCVLKNPNTYSEWYWKILNFLTFKLMFNQDDFHTVMLEK